MSIEMTIEDKAREIWYRYCDRFGVPEGLVRDPLAEAEHPERWVSWQWWLGDHWSDDTVEEHYANPDFEFGWGDLDNIAYHWRYLNYSEEFLAQQEAYRRGQSGKALGGLF